MESEKLHMSLAFAAVVLLSGCASSSKLSVKPNEHMEIGWTPRTVFHSPAYSWFDSCYRAYEPQREYVEHIRKMKDSVDIVVVYGTWCSDSRDQLPRFFRVMDSAGLPAERISLIAVDRKMQVPEGISQKYGITLVPTFIVRFRNVEVGRINESPRQSIEQDIGEMLSPFYQ